MLNLLNVTLKEISQVLGLPNCAIYSVIYNQVEVITGRHLEWIYSLKHVVSTTYYYDDQVSNMICYFNYSRLNFALFCCILIPMTPTRSNTTPHHSTPTPRASPTAAFRSSLTIFISLHAILCQRLLFRWRQRCRFDGFFWWRPYNNIIFYTIFVNINSIKQKCVCIAWNGYYLCNLNSL